MFQLSNEELEYWRSQIVMSNPSAKMGLRRSPYAFTEHGSLMLSSVLRSKHAVDVSIAVVQTFVPLREILATHEDVARKIEEHDRHIKNLYEHVERLLQTPEPTKRKMGYIWDEDE